MRWSNYNTFMVIVLVGAIGLFNIHCASVEITNARLYIAQQKWNDALQSLDAELEKYPHDAEAWFLKGRVLSELGRFDEMNESFDRSIEISDKYKKDIEEIRSRIW